MQLSYVLSPLAALALFASTGLTQAQARPRSVSLVFTGAAEGRFELQAPTDGSSFSIGECTSFKPKIPHSEFSMNYFPCFTFLPV